MKRSPVSPRPSLHSPVTNAPGARPTLRFSFRYWQQRPFFEVGDEDRQWFIALLERLQELSGLDLEEFRSDTRAKQAHRFHQINWDAREIPVRRDDLTWLPESYRRGEEFGGEFYQFQVSRANGRIVGFFDQDHTFQVVLLDPKHNLQPSKKVEYTVRETRPGLSPFAHLSQQCKAAMELIPADCSHGKQCPAIRRIDNGLGDPPHGVQSYVISSKVVADLMELESSHHKTLDDLIVDLILRFYDDGGDKLVPREDR